MFEIGDLVLVKSQHYRQNSLVAHKFPKLLAKFYGPYKITKKIGAVAYKLDSPASAAIRLVFHVSQLREAYLDSFSTPLPPSALLTELLQPQTILDRQIVKRGNVAAIQLLIHWANSLLEIAKWEFVDELRRRFPMFPLGIREI